MVQLNPPVREYKRDLDYKNVTSKCFPHLMPRGMNCPFTHLSFEDPTKFRDVKIEQRGIR